MKHTINEHDIADNPVGMMKRGLKLGDSVNVEIAAPVKADDTKDVSASISNAALQVELETLLTIRKDQQDKIDSLLNGINAFNSGVDTLVATDSIIQEYRNESDAPKDIYGNFFYAINKRLSELYKRPLQTNFSKSDNSIIDPLIQEWKEKFDFLQQQNKDLIEKIAAIQSDTSKTPNIADALQNIADRPAVQPSGPEALGMQNDAGTSGTLKVNEDGTTEIIIDKKQTTDQSSAEQAQS